MHEVSIVEGLIDLIEKQKEIHKFKRVVEIRIACGVYNCASEENLNFCFKTATEGTYLETALITVKRLPERWKCSACKIDFVRENKENEPCCSTCGTTEVFPLLNSEIYLDNLEVE